MTLHDIIVAIEAGQTFTEAELRAHIERLTYAATGPIVASAYATTRRQWLVDAFVQGLLKKQTERGHVEG